MTPLSKSLKRELKIHGRPFVVTLSPESLRVTPKGKRKGIELQWADLVSGEAALATALNASIGTLTAQPKAVEPKRPRRPRRKS